MPNPMAGEGGSCYVWMRFLDRITIHMHRKTWSLIIRVGVGAWTDIESTTKIGMPSSMSPVIEQNSVGLIENVVTSSRDGLCLDLLADWAHFVDLGLFKVMLGREQLDLFSWRSFRRSMFSESQRYDLFDNFVYIGPDDPTLTVQRPSLWSIASDPQSQSLCYSYKIYEENGSSQQPRVYHVYISCICLRTG